MAKAEDDEVAETRGQGQEQGCCPDKDVLRGLHCLFD